jgi:hypothetical protein
MAAIEYPIFTQTIGSGGVAALGFGNIPQGYTDLRLVFSARDIRTGINQGDMTITFNGDSGTNYSYSVNRNPGGTGQYNSVRPNQSSLWVSDESTSVGAAGTFGHSEIYIPNYTLNINKSVYGQSWIADTSSANVYLSAHSGLWRSTAAITSITIYPISPNFQQYSTFSLYGILRKGL